MISGDIILLALFIVTTVNVVRYVTTLRTLLFVMKEAHPLLYLQVDGRWFFTTHGDFNKQTKLLQYLWQSGYMNHHDPIFINKCEKTRHLLLLSIALFIVTTAAFFAII